MGFMKHLALFSLLLFGSLTAALAWPANLPPKPSLSLERQGTTNAVLKIQLGAKWKTYGDDNSGLPPAFDWSASKNLKTAKVLYPAPARLSTLGVAFLGYANKVHFPIKIEAKDARKPVRLALKLSYAICDKICIPLEAHFTLTLPPAGKI